MASTNRLSESSFLAANAGSLTGTYAGSTRGTTRRKLNAQTLASHAHAASLNICFLAGNDRYPRITRRVSISHFVNEGSLSSPSLPSHDIYFLSPPSSLVLGDKGVLTIVMYIGRDQLPQHRTRYLSSRSLPAALLCISLAQSLTFRLQSRPVKLSYQISSSSVLDARSSVQAQLLQCI